MKDIIDTSPHRLRKGGAATASRIHNKAKYELIPQALRESYKDEREEGKCVNKLKIVPRCSNGCWLAKMWRSPIEEVPGEKGPRRITAAKVRLQKEKRETVYGREDGAMNDGGSKRNRRLFKRGYKRENCREAVRFTRGK